jgi:hypothetical protein
VLTFIFGYLFLLENGRKWETAFGICNILMGIFISVSYLIQVLKLSHKLGMPGKSGRYDIPATTPAKSILSTSSNRDFRPARSVSFPESERSNRYAVTGGFRDDQGSWSDVMQTIDEDYETRETPHELQSDDDIRSDSPSHIVRIRRAQGDGADSDHIAHKPYNEVDNGSERQYGSHTLSLAEQRQQTVHQVLAGADEKAWYEEEDENYDRIQAESLARQRRPEGLSPSINDDESLRNRYITNSSLYPKVEVLDDHGWKPQSVEWPLDCKDLDDSSTESSTDSEIKPVQHHRRDSNRARNHIGHGRHSHSRRRRHHLSNHKHHHHHHHGYRPKAASGLDGRRYLRPQFSPVEQHEPFQVANPIYSSMSVSSFQSDESKVCERRLSTRSLHRRSSGEMEHPGSRSRSRSVESKTVTGDFLRRYKTPHFDSPAGTMPISLSTIYQQPRETSFGASPPPNDSHIRFVHGFDTPTPHKEQ